MIEQTSKGSIKGLKPYKIILVGGQAVGKSSLLHRIIQSKFDPNYTTTIGVDFKTIVTTIGSRQVGLQIWDTAGQQKFKALTQSYFRGAHGCICVYDINDKQSLERADHYIRDAFQFNIKPDCIYLLANKIDQCEQKQADSKGRQLANKFQINFAKVSAKTGEGLGNFIENIAVKIDKVYHETSQFLSQDNHHLRPKIKIQEEGSKQRCGC